MIRYTASIYGKERAFIQNISFWAPEKLAFVSSVESTIVYRRSPIRGFSISDLLCDRVASALCFELEIMGGSSAFFN